ncbi:MAG: RNA-directed DNA polymerase [Magnetococcales bacterium]|nr:RNA-directed DNA polymerase [Magnetococcales bacterium]
MSTNNFPIINIPSFSNPASLASLLSVSEQDLFRITSSVDNLYKPGKILQKKNGELRRTHDAKKPLKDLHEIIKNRILKKVVYPYYLLGGIADPFKPRNCTNNALIHSGKKILIAEDIENFFPSSSSDIVFNIWKLCFKFSPKIADILTKLTTYQNQLPQGWKTSGYLANLVFWDNEPDLVRDFEKRGYSYSRFIDDIAISSNQFINDNQKSYIISRIYSMLRLKGYKPKRTKHEIQTQIKSMHLTGLGINRKRPTVPRNRRNNVRLLVYNLEKRHRHEGDTHQYREDWISVSGKVGHIRSFHNNEWEKLKFRLNKIKPNDKV